jgi:hypothetical protein
MKLNEKCPIRRLKTKMGATGWERYHTDGRKKLRRSRGSQR